jgi:hypothetical protein
MTFDRSRFTVSLKTDAAAASVPQNQGDPMRRRLCIVLLLVPAAVWPGAATAAYTLDGGTPAEQATVRMGLAASTFPWQIVPTRVRIHIRQGVLSHAVPGEIWLDSHLLDAGRFSWAIVQHEFAHQVDFFLLNDAERTLLEARLGGVSWWSSTRYALAPDGSLAHGELTAERFASTLTWAYWPCRANVLRPESASDESAALPPAAFRALLASVLGLPGVGA